MNPTSAAASSTSATTLRPRNRRRTHDEDERAGSTLPKTSLYDGAPSASEESSRATSPLPRAHSSRPTRIQHATQRSRSKSSVLGSNLLNPPQALSTTLATGFGESVWSSLQGIASNLIGSRGGSRGSSPGHSPTRKRKPLDISHIRNTSAPPTRWGPSGNGDQQLGIGTREERRAQVQAKMRETLLAANGQVMSGASGRYKRRDSEDDASIPPGADYDRDALVYVHKVKPGDTLAGVMIKYNCQPNVFRKANRLWPNDSIQVRKTVVLPVDACGVRGRKIPESDYTLSNLGDSCVEDVMPTPTTTRIHPPWGDLHNAAEEKETPFSSIPTSPSISISLSNPEEPLWKHDSWVMIDGFPDAVEIARLSCRALGYFPRRRRKSQSFSDLETPPASLDLPRGSYQSTSPRKLKSRSSSGSYFASQLQGPGGVGTMGSNVHSPGPAQDGLNKHFAHYLPNLAPKSSAESLRSSTSHSNGIENFGGSIEGWVRKIATKASSGLQPPTPGGRSGVGDLIELSEDVFDIGDDSESHDGSRWDNAAATSAGTGSGTLHAEQERMLEERFPPRGRIFGESSRRGKSS